MTSELKNKKAIAKIIFIKFLNQLHNNVARNKAIRKRKDSTENNLQEIFFDGF